MQLTMSEQQLYEKVVTLLAQVHPIAQVLANYDTGDGRWWHDDRYVDKRGTVWEYPALVALYWETWEAAALVANTLYTSIHTRVRGKRYNETIQLVWQHIMEASYE